jgi:hypothetical protein
MSEIGQECRLTQFLVHVSCGINFDMRAISMSIPAQNKYQN